MAIQEIEEVLRRVKRWRRSALAALVIGAGIVWTGLALGSSWIPRFGIGFACASLILWGLAFKHSRAVADAAAGGRMPSLRESIARMRSNELGAYLASAMFCALSSLGYAMFAASHEGIAGWLISATFAALGVYFGVVFLRLRRSEKGRA